MKTDLKVDSFVENNGKLSVCVVKGTCNVFVDIRKEDFESWLEREDKLAWESNTSDHSGEHVQQAGKMLLSEYLGLFNTYIHDDLLEYMSKHPIRHKNRQYGNTIQFLNDQFKKRIKKHQRH